MTFCLETGTAGACQDKACAQEHSREGSYHLRMLSRLRLKHNLRRSPRLCRGWEEEDIGTISRCDPSSGQPHTVTSDTFSFLSVTRFTQLFNDEDRVCTLSNVRKSELVEKIPGGYIVWSCVIRIIP